MTYSDFLQSIADYFGTWPNDKIPGVILGYLKRDIREDRLPDLLRYVYYTHPPRLGAPGVSEIEDAIYKKVIRDKMSDPRDHSTAGSMPPPLDEPTEEERAEADRMIEEAGGIMKLITGTIKNERVKRAQEKADKKKQFIADQDFAYSTRGKDIKRGPGGYRIPPDCKYTEEAPAPPVPVF